MDDKWEGAFNSEAYEVARTVLERDRERATGEVKAVLSKRTRLVIVVAVVWAACSVAMTFANPELILVAEIGWVAIVIASVFFLFPAIMGRGNLDELFEQYEEQLEKLEAARVPMPVPASMEDLVAALDLVKLPEQETHEAGEAPDQETSEVPKQETSEVPKQEAPEVLDQETHEAGEAS